MIHVLPLLRRLVAGFLLLGLVGLTAAAESPRAFDLPGGPAEETLKLFAKQAGREIVFAGAAVAQVKTNPVTGELPPREALSALLANTGLVATEDSKSGAFAVRREAPVEKNAPARLQEKPATEGTQSGMRVEDGVVKLEDYTVTGSRIRANTGDSPIQPVLTFTSLDIERTGASSLGQLFQYIPAITSFSTGIGSETVTSTIASGLGSGQTGSRTTAQLRGGSQTETLLLVDGKRVPLTGLRNAGGNGYDLGGIPLSAIERVEVLLDGASAIYGADAINGVINVILKKRYSGTEVRFNYDNTFDGDAGFKTVSLTHGFSKGKWSGLATLSYAENNIMLLADRRLTSTFDRTVFGGITNQSQPTLYVEGTGSISAASGNLPGLTVPRVSIPANSSGTGLTVAQYGAAPAPIAGVTPGRQSAINYSRDRSAYVRLGYEFNEHLQLTGFIRSGQRAYHDNGQWRRLENVTIPANYPGNPFGTAVRLSKIFYDLPPIVNGSETRNDELGFSASGKLAHDWRYETAVNYTRGKNNMTVAELPGAGGQVGSSTVAAATFNTRLNAAIAAGRTPNLLYDSNTQAPNAENALDEFWVNTTQSRLNDLVQTWTYSAQADGPLFTLPAGEIRLVAGSEFREEYVDFPGSSGGQVWPVLPQRDVTSFYAETRIPVLSAKQKVPLFYSLDVNVAARTEDYSDFGRATTPRYGVAWRPVKPVLLRGSFGEGFLAPQLYRTAQQSAYVTLPASIIAIIYAGQTDLSRGNAPITGPLDQLSGGNPDLKPQLSENFTYGVVIDVPKVDGLSVSLDYFDYKYTDGFGNISSMMDRQRFAPETIVRGPKLATDPADWLGPIISFDNRTINISSARTSGYSFGVRYQRSTSWGDFGLNLAGEKTLGREERILPNSAPTASVAKKFVPMRLTTSLFWNRGAWDAGLTHVYGGKSWTDSSNATIAPSRYTDDVMRWDANVGYDFGRRADFAAKDASWWRRALHDTKLRVTIVNVLDEEPPLNVNGSFSSSVIDPRLRRYIIDFTKRF